MMATRSGVVAARSAISTARSSPLPSANDRVRQGGLGAPDDTTGRTEPVRRGRSSRVVDAVWIALNTMPSFLLGQGVQSRHPGPATGTGMTQGLGGNQAFLGICLTRLGSSGRE